MSQTNRVPQLVEARAVSEQIISILEDETTKLLNGPDPGALTAIVARLGLLTSGLRKLIEAETFTEKEISALKAQANSTEILIDDISESLWRPIDISLVHHLNRLLEAAEKPEPEKSLQGELRSHFHSLRLNLLEQTKGARMLDNRSDHGEVVERVFQQFFQRHLGSKYRVVRGGKIKGYDGASSGQIDVIVAPADCTLISPGDADDGKANVFIDQVLAAFMVTGNLTKSKLADDWKSLQEIPEHPDLEKEIAPLLDHPWPLCYVIGGRGDPIEKLESVWVDMCGKGYRKHMPQFILSLDSGYVYSGARRWPCPRYPGNYKLPEQVVSQNGIYGGLGLGWMLLQVRGRMAIMERRDLSSITRQQDLMHDSMYSSARRQSYSDRFHRSFTAYTKIFGSIKWGGTSANCHNRYPVHSLITSKDELFQDGLNPRDLSLSELFNKARLFRYSVFEVRAGMVALEECFNLHNKESFRTRFVVFLEDGEELDPELFADAKSFQEALEIAKQSQLEMD